MELFSHFDGNGSNSLMGTVCIEYFGNNELVSALSIKFSYFSLRQRINSIIYAEIFVYTLGIIVKCFACGEWRMRTATKQLQHNDEEWSVMGASVR